MRTIGLRTLLASPLLTRHLPAAGHDTVLLTFDDGPQPGVTDVVLQRLAQHGASALFCLVGRRVEKAPALARDIVDAGHAVGNHGHAHDMSPWPNLPAYLDDVERCSQAIVQATGRPPRAFRAPGGRIHRASLTVPRRCGLRPIHWSLDPRDYAHRDQAAASDLGRRLADEVRGRDIVLLHDDHAGIVALLDELLPRLRQRGLDLAGGPALLGLAGAAP